MGLVQSRPTMNAVRVLSDSPTLSPDLTILAILRGAPTTLQAGTISQGVQGRNEAQEHKGNFKLLKLSNPKVVQTCLPWCFDTVSQP